MRKLLLASIAALGATGVAQAQIQLVTQPAAGSTTAAFANPVPTLAPGQIVVRMNGRLAFYYGFTANGDVHGHQVTFAAPTASSPGSKAPTAVNGNGEKLTSTRMASYLRLYPGFDGMAANGLRYGVLAEIRQDNNKGATALPGGSATADGQRARGALYVRRASGYIADDSWGTLRFGTPDGPVTAMGGIGQFLELGDASFCGDTLAGGFNNVGAGGWPFVSCSGNMYTTTKVAYYTPQFAGFDFGIAYEPGTGATQSGTECPNIGAGCDALSSTGSNDHARRRNLLDMALRYRGTFNGVGIAAVGGYLFSGSITRNTGYTPSSSNPQWSTSAAAGPLDGLSVGYGGATISYAGVTVGGAVQGGAQSGPGLKYKEGVDQFSWVVGASYTTGPILLGISYFQSDSQGVWSPGRVFDKTRRDRGVYASLNYAIAPGLTGIINYGWVDSSQPGGDLLGTKAGVQDSLTFQQVVGGVKLSW